jgi:hypothetical protein
MSNRRRPRRLVQFLLVLGTDADALAAGLSYRCPLCDSEVAPSADAKGMLEVRHDDSCPWLKARTRSVR